MYLSIFKSLRLEKHEHKEQSEVASKIIFKKITIFLIISTYKPPERWISQMFFDSLSISFILFSLWAGLSSDMRKMNTQICLEPSYYFYKQKFLIFHYLCFIPGSVVFHFLDRLFINLVCNECILFTYGIGNEALVWGIS